MRVAAIHRVLSTLSVEQQVEIMNVYRDVAGWTAEKAVMAGIITTWEEHALVDAATIRSLEADVEQLTADKERLTVGITKLKKKAALDAANFRLLVRALINNDSKLFMQLPLE